jgi:ABC-type nitrate/sulfonate/bicarbonate transport system substrate-binding protein
MKGGYLFFFMVILIGVVVSAWVSEALLASQSSPAPRNTMVPVMTTVKVAYSPTTANAPLYIAKDEGYFARQGIDVELVSFPSSTAALPGLVNGDIAVSGGALTSGLYNAIAHGAHVRIVADKGRLGSQGYCNATALMVRKDLFENGTVRSIADLRGHKIMAINDQEYSISNALSMGNLTMDDVGIVKMDYPSGFIALQNGAVDAGFLTEPYITKTLDRGAAVVLLPGTEYYQDFPLPLFYGPVLLDKDPDLGRRFMVAYLQGVKQYNEGKTEQNLEILGNYTRLDHNLLQKSCWLPVAENGTPPRKPVMDYMAWLYANGSIPRQLNEDEIFDMRFVTYATSVLENATSVVNSTL